MRFTVTDLAKICGVSRGTVDRALNGRPGISSQTRQYVLEVAKQNGYTPNVLARSLATGKSNTIGVVVFDLRNRHFAQLISAIQGRLTEAGYFSYICITEKDRARELQIVRDLAARKVEGIILMPINDSDRFEEEMGDLRIPVVAVSNRLSEHYPYVGSDFYAASYQGMNEFYTRGYRNVSFICPSVRNANAGNAYAQIQRAEGYRGFMREHPDMTGNLITDYDYFDDILREVAHSAERPGFFCSSDFYALNILHQAHEKGLRLPENFGLMGFDYIDTLDVLEKRLSTICYPIERVGRTAAELLMKSIATPDLLPEDVLIDCSIIPGQTL